MNTGSKLQRRSVVALGGHVRLRLAARLLEGAEVACAPTEGALLWLLR